MKEEEILQSLENLKIKIAKIMARLSKSLKN